MKRGEKTDRFAYHLEDNDLKRERNKARELRESQWWKRRLAKGACHYCGRTFPPRELTMDHIVPVSRGGRTTKGNVVACCKECNNAKKQLLPMEWEDYLQRFGPTRAEQRLKSAPAAADNGRENESSDESGEN
ncbi:MAG: HNH endonuclease [Deltaproteobacteria bacterium]|nr:HNH endonuclease [Deltaproteobacteria bacterium]